METIEGEIMEIEGRKTDKGQHYKRVRVENKWGSYWGNKEIEEGQMVEAKYEDVKNGQFTNWKEFDTLDQEEEKESKNKSSSKSKGNNKVNKAQRRFEIRKQVALKASVKTIENPTVKEIKKIYPMYVNLLSKPPEEFHMTDESEEMEE